MSTDLDGVPLATSINCGVCDTCAGVHVNLFDEDGDLLATAVVPVEVVDLLIARLRECKGEAQAKAPAGTVRQ